MTDYTKKRTWRDRQERDVRQVRPIARHADPERYDYAEQAQYFRKLAQKRADWMQTYPEYFEAWCELYDAENEYSKVKNTKKSNPPVFYAARDRMYAARWAVIHLEERFEDEVRWEWLSGRRHDKTETEHLHELWGKWLAVSEVDLRKKYTRRAQGFGLAKRHPERINWQAMHRIFSNERAECLQYCAEQYAHYQTLLRLLETEGKMVAQEWHYETKQQRERDRYRQHEDDQQADVVRAAADRESKLARQAAWFAKMEDPSERAKWIEQRCQVTAAQRQQEPVKVPESFPAGRVTKTFCFHSIGTEEVEYYNPDGSIRNRRDRDCIAKWSDIPQFVKPIQVSAKGIVLHDRTAKKIG